MHFLESSKVLVYNLDRALNLVSAISVFNRIKTFIYLFLL